jgi:hypothetical protein
MARSFLDRDQRDQTLVDAVRYGLNEYIKRNRSPSRQELVRARLLSR